MIEQEERQKFKERSESNMSEVARASKKLNAKDTGKIKKKKRDTREDQILD